MTHSTNEELQDEYQMDIMLPYGTIESRRVMVGLKSAAPGAEKKEVELNAHLTYTWRDPDPQPTSQDTLLKENAEEEQKNKELERSKRAEQKDRLDREKNELAE